MRALLLDLDGVIYQGEQPIPGAADALAWIRANDIPHLFVTNTSSRPRSALCDKLARMGIDVTADALLTPPAAAARWLKANSEGPVALFVAESTQSEFDGLPLWDGDESHPVAAVVVGDLGEGWTFQRLNQAFRCLTSTPDTRLVALGMTRYWRSDEGLVLDTGPFVAALQYASGVEPLVIGKPAPAFFRAGAETLGVAPGDLWMIGDDIRGDVEGAQKAGLKGLLVRTGKFQPRDLEGEVQPDAVLDSIVDLPRWWQESVAP